MAYQILRWLHQKTVGLTQKLGVVIIDEIAIGS